MSEMKELKRGDIVNFNMHDGATYKGEVVETFELFDIPMTRIKCNGETFVVNGIHVESVVA